MPLSLRTATLLECAREPIRCCGAGRAAPSQKSGDGSIAVVAIAGRRAPILRKKIDWGLEHVLVLCPSAVALYGIPDTVKAFARYTRPSRRTSALRPRNWFRSGWSHSTRPAHGRCSTRTGESTAPARSASTSSRTSLTGRITTPTRKAFDRLLRDLKAGARDGANA